MSSPDRDRRRHGELGAKRITPRRVKLALRPTGKGQAGDKCVAKPGLGLGSFDLIRFLLCGNAGFDHFVRCLPQAQQNDLSPATGSDRKLRVLKSRTASERECRSLCAAVRMIPVGAHIGGFAKLPPRKRAEMMATVGALPQPMSSA